MNNNEVNTNNKKLNKEKNLDIPKIVAYIATVIVIIPFALIILITFLAIITGSMSEGPIGAAFLWVIAIGVIFMIPHTAIYVTIASIGFDISRKREKQNTMELSKQAIAKNKRTNIMLIIALILPPLLALLYYVKTIIMYNYFLN